MHSEASSIRQRFVLLEEGGETYDYATEKRKRKPRSRRKRLVTAAIVVSAVVYVKILFFRMAVVSFASWMLHMQGGVCTTASEVALSFRTPQRLANALPTVVVLKDVHLWYPIEVARSGAQNSIEHSRLCGGDERRVVRASLFTVDSTGIAPIVSRQLRKTFKGVEAACVQRSLETIAGGDACGGQR